MKIVLIHVAGLNTDPEGPCLGMRALLEGLAETLSGKAHFFAHDDPDLREKIAEAAEGAEFVAITSHSYGAFEAYEAITAGVVKSVDVAAFNDLAPKGRPVAWKGPPWPTPPICKKGVWFWQRNDIVLCGVRGEASPTTEVYDLTDKGLHHSDMCGDPRVHDRIKLAIVAAVNAMLHHQFSSAAASSVSSTAARPTLNGVES